MIFVSFTTNESAIDLSDGLRHPFSILYEEEVDNTFCRGNNHQRQSSDVTIKNDTTKINKKVFYENRMYSFDLFVVIDTLNKQKSFSSINWERDVTYPAPSDELLQSLMTIKDSIESFSIRGQLDFLLAFCQQQQHVDDRLLYGEERYFSPELTIAAEKTDCDDKSILFSFLVWEILGMESVLLIYPEIQHVNIGLNYYDGVGGYVEYDNKKLLICEPSSLWTLSGQQMPLLDKNTQIIILPVNHKEH